MTRENAAQYLPLVQALAEGKTIQFNNNGTWEDFDSDSVAFGNVREHYRIKPEAREWRAAVSPHTGELYSVQSVDGLGGWQIIRVREILD